MVLLEIDGSLRALSSEKAAIWLMKNVVGSIMMQPHTNLVLSMFIDTSEFSVRLRYSSVPFSKNWEAQAIR